MAPIRRNPTLSEDLISEILVRVPVKSLLCFQLVSKTWLSLIKHPDFVNSQFRHAITTQTDQTLIITRFRSYKEMKFALLHVDSRQIVADLKYPYSPRDIKPVHGIRLVGSANGIVCVAVVNLSKGETSIYLWNPAIRQSKLIPPYNTGGYYAARTLGFGYDQIGHDFKVFIIGSLEHFSAEVYSANRNVWRKVSNPIDAPFSGHFDVCVNGLFCGIGNYGMMAFDLNKEVLNCAIKLPVISHDVHDDDQTRIIKFNKSIAVIILWANGSNSDKPVWRLDKKINMWMLNDDACLRGGGVEASWTPMFSIDLAMPAHLFLGYFNNGNLLLLISNDDYMWISCNASKKEAKIVPISVEMAGHHHTYDVHKYTESLVSLPGFKQVNWNAGEDDN